MPGAHKHGCPADKGPPVVGAPIVLTGAELAVLATIDDLISELGYAPTYEVMLERLGWRSRGTLHRYLERLRGKQVISGRGRSLRVVR